jgi:hypothetical protein
MGGLFGLASALRRGRWQGVWWLARDLLGISFEVGRACRRMAGSWLGVCRGLVLVGRGLVGACVGLVGNWSGPALGLVGSWSGPVLVGRELVGACFGAGRELVGACFC